jgi:hypothetical protein
MAKIIDQLIINSSYREPKEHWSYNPKAKASNLTIFFPVMMTAKAGADTQE